MLESNSLLLESARFTPDGQSAKGLDSVMLLAMWCFYLASKHQTLKLASNESLSSSEPVSASSSRSSSPPSSITSSPTSCSPINEDGFLNCSPPTTSKCSLFNGTVTTDKPTYSYPHDVYIAAGMGKPAFPISPSLLEEIDKNVNKLRKLSREAGDYINLSASIIDEYGKSWRDLVSEKNAVSDYGPPQGDLKARTRMAKALSRWYYWDHNIHSASLSPDDILYTVGEVAALHCIFSVLNHDNPSGIIVTPFPYYSLYRGAHKQNNLHPIHITQETDYKLSAKCLEDSLLEANSLQNTNGRTISAFLFCDPNNPFGTIVEKEEWYKIAVILRRYPNIPIILDECYTTMRLDGGRCTSLLTIAPDLKERLIILRSATKALSAAGERMAVAIIPNKKLRAKVVAENVAITGHAPTLLQTPFAAALEQYNNREHQVSNRYYREGVEYIAKRLDEMGAALPGNYHPGGAFYVMADLHELIGSPLPQETKQVLGESFLPTNKIHSDIGIVYSLLFRDKVMVAAGSFFGLPATYGWVRITASRGDAELKELMKRIEDRLRVVREEKISELINQIRTRLEFLEVGDSVDSKIFDILKKRFIEFEKENAHSPRLDRISTKELLTVINQLKSLAEDINKQLPKGERAKIRAQIRISSLYRGFKVRKEIKEIKAELTSNYLSYVAKKYKFLPTIQAAMFKLRPNEWIQMDDCRNLRLEAIKKLIQNKQSEPDANTNYLTKHSVFNRVLLALSEDKKGKSEFNAPQPSKKPSV